MAEEGGAGAKAESGASAASPLKPGDEGYVPPKDEKEFVPKTQFLAALHNANQKYDALARQFEELKAQGSKPAESAKRYTIAELNAAVRAEQITQGQADELYAKQTREDLKDEVTREVLSTVNSEARQERVGVDLSEYKRLAPEIMDEGSEVRAKVAEEFQYLVGIGQPRTLQTELAAIRAVLGPLEKLRVARSARREEESHEETGGGGESRNSRKAKSLVDTLTAREKDYYDGMIKKGQYKDWKAVEAELQFARPETRRKAGARV